MSQTKIFAGILRPCETTIRHVLIVFIVSGKTPAKFVVPGLWAHGKNLNRDVLSKPGWKEEICTCWDVRGRWPFWSWRINNCSSYEQSGGISSSDDIVLLNTDQPDRPRAKRRGSQCGTPPSGSGFSHWKVRSHSSLDRFTGQRSLGESTSGEFVDKSTGHLCSTGPGGPPEGTGRDKSHRPNPRNRIGSDRTELGVNLQTSTPVAGLDRTGPDRTGCQSPDESTGHGTVELFTGQRTLD